MLTPRMTQAGPRAGPAARPRGSPRARTWFAPLLKGLLCIAAFALLSPAVLRASKPPRTQRKTPDVTQYTAGGTRWLDSRSDEVVHFICQRGTPYRISLDSASLRDARVSASEHRRFLEALRQAVADWSALMGCHRFRVELDLPYPNTRIHFVRIDAPGTLATATRAGDITLNIRRRWFAGDKHRGNYSADHRQVSFYWVVAHELGHVWGLAHSARPDSLMYPSQCHTCRWSSFEQAAGNVIRASSQAPAWSRPHYANTFFAKTPRSVVDRLLKGDLPRTPTPNQTVDQDQCDAQTCDAEPSSTDPTPDGCGTPELIGEVALMGWRLFTLPRVLIDALAPRLEPLATSHARPPLPPPDSDVPLPPLPDPRAAVLSPMDRAGTLWTVTSRAHGPEGSSKT